MWNKPLVLCSFFLMVASVQVMGHCRKAKSDDVPHGANELIQLTDQSVSTIRGEVSGPGDGAAKDIVVEIYSYAGGDSNEGVKNALAQKRIAACITGEDGEFSFPHIKHGKYLLRAGARESRGINETYIILVVDPHLKKDDGKGLRLPLYVGT